MYATSESLEKRDEIHSIIAEDLRLHGYLDSMTTQGQLQPSQTTIPDSEDKSKFPVLGSEKDEISIEESTTHYGEVNGLILHLPEDQTTDQSIVKLDFMSSDNKIADIKLSHMEAAFLYYLGAEREAGESYWLHAPNKHRELLLKIWNSFSLPQSFENELELESAQKDSTTWIWDFRNTNRKTLRNQIQRKIKYLHAEALDFNLITSIKPKSPSRGGNYKLNNQITSFEISKPSR